VCMCMKTNDSRAQSLHVAGFAWTKRKTESEAETSAPDVSLVARLVVRLIVSLVEPGLVATQGEPGIRIKCHMQC
jgi:hypothetical protein